MWSLWGCTDERDFEFQPVALFKMMNAPIERQQKFEGRSPPRDRSYHLVI